MKYSKERLESVVQSSKSIAEVVRQLGLKVSGGNHSHISRKIKMWNIDCSHFTGQRWNIGLPARNKKEFIDILVLSNRNYRINISLLRRALLETGRTYQCETCGNKGLWNDTTLVLEIDHKNGNWQDNRPENLAFLCPNCHSQKR